MPQWKDAPHELQTELLLAGLFGDRPEGWPPTADAAPTGEFVGGQPSGRSPFAGKILEGGVILVMERIC